MTFNIKDLTIGQAQEITAMFSQSVIPIPNETYTQISINGDGD